MKDGFFVSSLFCDFHPTISKFPPAIKTNSYLSVSGKERGSLNPAPGKRVEGMPVFWPRPDLIQNLNEHSLARQCTHHLYDDFWKPIQDLVNAAAAHINGTGVLKLLQVHKASVR